MNAVLRSWNLLPADEAASTILPCCGSHPWANALSAARPLPDEVALLHAADRIWLELDLAAWDEAFSSHPRIGESKAPSSATAQSAHWSGQEQRSLDTSGAEIKERLKLGNAAYERRFGRTYIVCATDKSAEQMLSILEQRMKNSEEQELCEAVEQQRQITQLRLRRWLQS